MAADPVGREKEAARGTTHAAVAGQAATQSDEKARRAAAKAAEKARREEERRRAEEERAAREAAEAAARAEAARAAAERAVAAATADGGFDVRGVLREVAKPRLTGSHGAAEVGGTVRACFEALGYEVQGRTFRFNPWPGRFGITVAGVLYLLGVMGRGLPVRRPAHGAVATLLLMLLVIGPAGC
jgi:hypothetical protein